MLSLESSCCTRKLEWLLLTASMTGLQPQILSQQSQNRSCLKGRLSANWPVKSRRKSISSCGYPCTFLGPIGLLGKVTAMRCLEIRRSKPLRRRRRGSARHAVCGTASTDHMALSTDPIALSTASTDHIAAPKGHIAAPPARPHAAGSSEPWQRRRIIHWHRLEAHMYAQRSRQRQKVPLISTRLRRRRIAVACLMNSICKFDHK